MNDLRDSKLTAAQLNVLVELNSTGKLPKGVRPRTIEILREGKFIDVTRVGDEDPVYVLRTEGKKEIGINVEESVEETFHQKLMADVAELEADLRELELTIAEEPMADWELELLHGAPEVPAKRENTEEKPFQYFDEAWNSAKRVEAGFGATLLFRNTHVWDGLTAKEIRADIKTAVPTGRAGKRRAAKVQQKAATAVRMALRELAAA